MKAGYKQTEVGVIPEEWEVCQLGELLQGSRSVRYGVVQPGKFEPTGCFMLRSQDYSKGWAGPEGMHKITLQLENQYKNARIRREDLVMTVVGAGIGQVVVVPDWVDGTILSRSTARVAIDEEKAASRFVKAFLEGPIGKRQILDCQKEGAQPVVSCPDLAKFFVANPPLPEQRAIAAALSDVDGLLGALDRLIAKKRDLKQAAMQQLLTGQTRLPGFKGEWVVKRLGEVATFYKGKGLPKSAISESGAEPCIHYGELFTRYPETIGEILSRTDTSEGVFRSVANDVLMPTSDVTPRGLAKASCVRVNGVILGGDILVIRSDTKVIHGSFLSLLIRYEETQVLQLVTGSTVYHLYGSDMKNFTFSVPPLSEQTAIASVLSEMDAELAGLEQRREKTRALKQGMMQELLTGRTRLPDKL